MTEISYRCWEVLFFVGLCPVAVNRAERFTLGTLYFYLEANDGAVRFTLPLYYGWLGLVDKLDLLAAAVTTGLLVGHLSSLGRAKNERDPLYITEENIMIQENRGGQEYIPTFPSHGFPISE